MDADALLFCSVTLAETQELTTSCEEGVCVCVCLNCKDPSSPAPPVPLSARMKKIIQLFFCLFL